MTDVLLDDDDKKKEQEANIAIKAAQSLREYSVSKDARTESDLIEILNTRPSLVQRFFPTEGHRVSQQITADRLRQLAEDRKEIGRIHHETYRNSLKIIANVHISKLEMEGKAELARHYELVATDTQRRILSSQESMTDELVERYDRVHKKYANHPQFLQDELKKIDIVRNNNMLSTEKLVNEILKTLDEKIK